MRHATAPIHVICHDQSLAISGRLRRADDWGCELISNVRTAGPAFAKKTRVLLNLLDEKTGQTMNVLARLTAVARDQGCWVYKIRWRSLPALLESYFEHERASDETAETTGETQDVA